MEKRSDNLLLPFYIGTLVGLSLYVTVGWWAFLLLFPWIGGAVSLGIAMNRSASRGRKSVGRRVCLLLIMPMLLFFVPFVNNENFQLEGVVLIVLVGYFSKGFIHFAVAKLFGPLAWGRGFCGWACWTAAALEWLPIKKRRRVPEGLRNMRYVVLAVSVAIPAALVFVYGFDVKGSYISRMELAWMMSSNAVYYAAAIVLAFAFADKRAFCKVACPVALVMKPGARLSMLKRKPTDNECTGCGVCVKACPMDVDVMGFISRGERVTDTECIQCNECRAACPQGAIG